MRKHVCVIGAGSSGLMVMKELQSVGHTFHCFEMLPNVGGVYVKSYRNTILTTSSLLTAWSDHSDGKENIPTFWTAEEYIKYLISFSEKHNLQHHISFRHSVRSVRKCLETNKWLVTVLGGRSCQGLERCDSYEEDPAYKPIILTFDAIAVCTGTNTFSAMPHFEGEELFKGKIIHAEHYRSPDEFNGKHVLIVGAGESGSDITNEISKVAATSAICIRGLHGHILPRTQGNGTVSDLNTNRCRYSNPYLLGDWIGYVNQLSKNVLLKLQPQSDQSKVLLKVGELNLKQKTSAFTKFGCKNEGFVSAMVLRGTELHRDKFKLTEDRAKFDDGSEFICDAIICCTGYRNCFPFFDEFHPELSHAGMNPRENYKQIFAVDCPGEVGFFGFARPAFGSIPPTTEMQARLWAMVVDDQIELPSKRVMIKIAEEDQNNWQRRFGLDAHRVKGLVDYQIYCDMLAEEMGCMPPMNQLLLTKPWLWLKIMFGPFTVHQYRLFGPQCDPINAERAICRHPFGDMLESAITLFFLVLAKLLYSIGYDEYKPNNF